MKLWDSLVDKANQFLSFGDDSVGQKTPLTPSSPRLFDGAAISSLIPLRSYDAEHDMCINKNSYGFGLELAPMTGADDNAVNQIAQAFSQLEENSYCQVITEISNKVQTTLDNWATYRTDPNPMLQKMTQERLAHFRKGINGSIFEKPFHLMDHRVYLFWSKSGKPKGFDLDKVVSMRETLMASLDQAGIPNRILNKEDICSVTADWVTRTSRPYPAHVEIPDYDATPLNHLAVEPDSKIRLKLNNLVMNEGTRDAYDVRVLTIKKRPRVWAQWQNQKLLGDIFTDSLRFRGPVLMVTTWFVPKQEKMQEKAATEAVKMAKKAEDKSILSSLNTNSSQQAQEWMFVNKHLNDGEKAVKMHQTVILYAPDGQGNRCEAAATAIFESAGWKTKRVRFLPLGMFISCIPFVPAEGHFEDLEGLGLVRHMMTWNMANLTCLQGEWRGQEKDPLLLLLGRRGQLMAINNFLNPDGNYNISVVGKSGSGKSVAMNAITEAVLATGGRDFTIDIGGSYKHSCSLFNGTYIDLDDSVSLNPFTHIGPAPNATPQEQNEYWQEVYSMITSIVISMARQRQDVSDTEESLLYELVPRVINQHRQETTFTKIHDAIMDKYADESIPQQTRATIYELAMMIKPFTAEGPWGKFFERPCNIDFSSRYVVLETERFSNGGARMLQVVMKILMYHVTEAMYLGDRKKPIILKIDEGWKLLEGRDSKFVEDVSRRARKYNGALVTGTQGVDDYFKNEAAKAVFMNSDWLFMMSQKKESIAALKKSGRLVMDEYLEKLIKSVRRDDERYSEIMVMGPSGIQAIGRLTLDRFSIASYTTKGKDYTRVSELKKHYEKHGFGSDALVMALEHIKHEYALQQEGYSADEANRIAGSRVVQDIHPLAA